MHLLYATDHRVDAYLVKALREAGHVVEQTDQPADGLAMAASGEYRAVLLDWSAPPVPCAARFAATAPRSLVVVIAAVADDAQRAAILRAGADVCFTRPASFIELEARLEALDRLVQRGRPGSVVSAEMVAAEQAIRLDGRAIGLSRQEYRVMAYLVANAGEVVGLERLQQHVRGDGAEPRPDLLRACVSRLRRKLQAAGAGSALRVLPGHGYCFQPEREPARDGAGDDGSAQNENRLTRPTAPV